MDTAVKLTDTLRAEAKGNGCPLPKFIVIGYSQGAMAARALAGYPDVVGVLNLGDPEQSRFAAGNEGTGAKGEGVIRFKYPGLKSVFDSYDNNSVEDKIALCHKDDPICDFQLEHANRLLDPKQHVNYLLDTDEAATYGKKLAQMAHKYYVPPTTEPAVPPSSRVGLDTMIAIDTTGSMGPYLKAAVASAEAIARKSLSAAQHARVGLVEYKDHSVDSFGARVVVPLTGDIQGLKKGLESLEPTGGGDDPEDVYSAIVTALSADWNPVAARSIVVIGDAPPHDPESDTCYTGEQVTRLLAGVSLVSSVPSPNTRAAEESSQPCASASPAPSPEPTPSDTYSLSEPEPVPSETDSAGPSETFPSASPESTASRSYGSSTFGPSPSESSS
ncbi:VWA domain-containing protein, partial [Bacillus mobilis]|uniref:VWA domain-containing protein n=1 Tax=Bacillus mobilis TaxID=2026190 RepID=UPI00363F999A